MYNIRTINIILKINGMLIIKKILGIQAVINDNVRVTAPPFLNEQIIGNVRRFHAGINGYAPTPLVNLQSLANELGVANIFVKDESHRFDLNAFKVLGSTYSIAMILCEKFNLDPYTVTFNDFKKPDIFAKIKNMIFISATDGNHGRGVAWMATQLGGKSIIYMPKNSSRQRIMAIEHEGAEVIVTKVNYDDTVRMAKRKAEEIGGYLVQDTALEGYEKIPNWITAGYTTTVAEAAEQMALESTDVPTHIFLQAGVGSFAGAVTGYYANIFKYSFPKIIIIEPEEADCMFQSALANDGHPHIVTGDLNTIMAGLACGEPNVVAWKILRDNAMAFVSCPDYVAARGMRILTCPRRPDKQVISGESGAVGLGLLSLLTERYELQEIKKQLGLGKHSKILFFNTEGDTDRENYKRIVYDGMFQTPF